MSSGSDEWYVRTRGRVLGPFKRPQLLSMRDRGQLTPEHEISQDRRSWIKAADLPSVQTKPADTQSQPSAAAAAERTGFALADEPVAGPVATPSADAGASWFVARGETHQGPISSADLRRLLSIGEIGPGSLVWKEGMANWAPASEMPELRLKAAAGSSGSPAAAPFQATVQNTYGLMPRTSGLAIASLVLGLVWLGGLGSLLATIFGAVSLSQISRSNGGITGKGLALAGLILGIVGLVSVAFTILFGLLASLAGHSPRP